jgi:hypothetical protein
MIGPLVNLSYFSTNYDKNDLMKKMGVLIGVLKLKGE